jgi:glycosyltransferase involved in cell wall biosynthesis
VGERPKVSIGLTVYNGEQFLHEAVDAFLGQTFADFELILSDNCSTDATEAIGRAYAEKDPRVRYSRNANNLGLAGNHNRVVELARGEYCKWAAADDICLPQYLARCVEVLESEPGVVLAYPQTQFVDTAGQPVATEDPGWNLRSDSVAERLRFCIYAGHWANAVTGLMRTAALRRTRLMPSYPGGDFRVLTELSTMGKFYEIPERLFLRRLHAGSSSQHTNDEGWETRYWTGRNGAVCYPGWSLSRDKFRTILRADLGLGEKVSLTGSLLRSMRWEQRRLMAELRHALSLSRR